MTQPLFYNTRKQANLIKKCRNLATRTESSKAAKQTRQKRNARASRSHSARNASVAAPQPRRTAPRTGERVTPKAVLSPLGDSRGLKEWQNLISTNLFRTDVP